MSRRQMVEIAKALARNPRILILDEATSALTAADVAKVFAVLKRLRNEGLALLYISHRMHEIAELADECTVFRNGRNVATFKAGTKTDNEVVEMMIGREYSHIFPPRPAPPDSGVQPMLEVRNLSWTDRLKDISLKVRPGEVVGLGGLDGQGQRELLLALFGVLRGVSGEIQIDGRKTPIGSPRAAKSKKIGMALIPEDRKTEGLMLPMSVRDNLSFAAIDRLSHFGMVDRAAERKAIDDMIQLLAIRTAGIEIPVGALSGGNQQKVVIAKWLMVSPRIILLNDPTRGIDVGTKQELYQLLRKLAASGAAILFYSTDYDELIGCCDRVLVLYDGGIRKELIGAEDHRTRPDQQRTQHQSGHGRSRRDAGGRRMRGMALLFRGTPRHPARCSRIRADVRHLCQQPSGWLQLQCGHNGLQQERASRACRHGPDHGGVDRRHRSLCRHDRCADELCRILDRGRRRLHYDARAFLACCSPASLAARSTALL